MGLRTLDLPLCICLSLEGNCKLYYIFGFLEKRGYLPMLYNPLIHFSFNQSALCCRTGRLGEYYRLVN